MNDLISRDDAIKAIERKAYRHTYLDQIIDVVKSLPSVTPDLSEYSDKLWRKAYERGKAEARGTSWWAITPHGARRCGNCDALYPNTTYPRNYCPSCGARMEKEVLWTECDAWMKGGEG